MRAKRKPHLKRTRKTKKKNSERRYKDKKRLRWGWRRPAKTEASKSCQNGTFLRRAAFVSVVVRRTEKKQPAMPIATTQLAAQTRFAVTSVSDLGIRWTTVNSDAKRCGQLCRQLQNVGNLPCGPSTSGIRVSSHQEPRRYRPLGRCKAAQRAGELG